jgi:hypothetical protein
MRFPIGFGFLGLLPGLEDVAFFFFLAPNVGSAKVERGRLLPGFLRSRSMRWSNKSGQLTLLTLPDGNCKKDQTPPQVRCRL